MKVHPRLLIPLNLLEYSELFLFEHGYFLFEEHSRIALFLPQRSAHRTLGGLQILKLKGQIESVGSL